MPFIDYISEVLVRPVMFKTRSINQIPVSCPRSPSLAPGGGMDGGA